MSSREPLSPGKLLGGLLGGRFRLKKIVGTPGTSVLYLAKDLHRSSEVHVKLLGFDARTDPKLFEAALHDAETLAKVPASPNVVEVVGAGQFSTQAVFIALEREEGDPLDQWLLNTQGPARSIEELTQVSLSLTQGIGHLHQNGIVHGQIRPWDFILSRAPDGAWTAKAQNYGISRIPNLEERPDPLASMGQAPEQIVGQSNSFATDVFSLGALLFQMFAESLTLDRTSFPFVTRSHASTPPSQAEQQIIQILQTCLAKHPADRYPSAQPIVSELELIVANQDPSPPEPLSPPPLSSMPQSRTSVSIAAENRGLPAAPPVVMHQSASSQKSPIVIGQQQGMNNLPESTRHFGNSTPHHPTHSDHLLDTMNEQDGAQNAKLPESSHQSKMPQIVLACLTVFATGFAAWWFISDNNLDFLTPSKQVASASIVPAAPVAIPTPPAAPPQPIVQEQRTAKIPPPPPPAPVKKPKPPAPRPSIPKSSPRAPAFLTNLSDQDIRSSLRGTRQRIHASCPAPKGYSTVNANITVLPNGTVARVKLTAPIPESEVGRCVVRHALETKYPQRSRSQPSQVRAAFHWGERRRISRTRRAAQSFDSL